MKKRRVKALECLLLSVMVIIAMMPFGVFAEGEADPDAGAAVTEESAEAAGEEAAGAEENVEDLEEDAVDEQPGEEEQTDEITGNETDTDEPEAANEVRLKNEIKSSSSTVEDFLDDDWVYVKKFELSEQDGIIDGTESWDDLDNGPSNKKVRTYDTVKYNMSYRVETYDLDNVAEGYMCYKFVLPAGPKEAEWATGAMGWLGTKYDELADLKAAVAYGGGARIGKVGGYCAYTEGGNQIIEGYRYLTGTDTNPYAFPGSGTLNATVQVLLPDYGFEIKPTFSIWMDHNTTKGECEEHGRNEVVSFTADPVKVVSELRMNAAIESVSPTYSTRIGDYDFDTDGEGKINYGEETVYGATAIYGVTLQLYNRGTDTGLKGCALPTGDISVNIDLNAVYKTDDGEEIDLTALGYKPLVYNYATNKNNENLRELPSGLSKVATGSAPYDNQRKNASAAFSSNTKGTYNMWNGGNWTGTQDGATATFVNSGYIINPYWFPNSKNSGNAKATDYYDYTLGPRACDVGSFAAMKLYVVYPTKFTDNNGNEIDIVSEYGEGTILYKTSDVKLSANSSAGSLQEVSDNSNQKKMTDDLVSGSLYLSRPGQYSTIIRYTRDYTTGMYDTDGTSNNIMNGYDTAALGQEIGLAWTLNATTNGIEDNMIAAAQNLIKFDADAIKLGTEAVTNDSTSASVDKRNVTFLYGAKKDKTNWTGDDEMNEAREGDLVYFRTLSELEEAGYKCVAILAEWRFDDDYPYYSNKEIGTRHQAYVVEDDDLCGKVYPIIIVNDFWTRQDLADLDLDIKDFPSIIDVQEGTAKMPDLITGPIIVNQKTQTRLHQLAGTFNKAEYTDGVCTKDQNAIHLYGDSLYIVQYKAKIQKLLCQEENGSAHQVFDLDYRQRVADYALQVDLSTDQRASKTRYTTVTITDTLPAGLSYRPGSSWYGGTYTQNGLGIQGTVTGGRSLEPTAVPNDDGTTTLTWVISDAPIGETLPPIYYSCDIGEEGSVNDVNNNDSLENTVTVMTPEDNREPTKVNSKLATAAIKVSKLNETSVSKVADKKYIEATDDAGWTFYVGNNAVNNIPYAVMVDTLPANGDISGTNIGEDNVMTIKEWKIDTTTADNVSEWRAFYTTSDEASQTTSSDYIYDSALDSIKGKEGSSAYEQSANVEWVQTDISIDGDSASIPALIGKTNVTAVAVVGTLKSKQTYKAHVVTGFSEPLGQGERLANTISRGDDTGRARTYPVTRSLEGVVWIDDDNDGYRDHITDDSEEVVSGVNVTLMKLKTGGDSSKADDYEPFTLSSGDTAVVYTGKILDLSTGKVSDYDLNKDGYDSGHYRFDGLPEGQFAVKFEEGNYSFASTYSTKQDEGSDDMYDSDATPSNKENGFLESAVITGIEMPALSAMASNTYVSRYNDLGLYKTGKLKITKDLSDHENVKFGERIDETSFIFSVKVTYKGKTFYDDIVTMVFNEAGSQTVTLGDFPVGAEAVVEEIYAGGNYEVEGDGKVTVTIKQGSDDDEDIAEAKFTNSHDGGYKGGGSVENTYEKDENGGWNVTPKYSVSSGANE